MTAKPPSAEAPWSWPHTAGLLLLTLLAVLLCSWVPGGHWAALWWGVMLLLALTAVIVGQGITGYWRGILIDERNKMSLSRLQLALWTILIVSALLVLFFWRLRTRDIGDPLAIGIPTQIWTLLGISTTSLVGSSLIKTSKKNQPRNLDEERETAERFRAQGRDPSTLLATGREVLNQSPAQASWADLFRGDESGNAATASLGKFQMFYFTLIAVVSYGYLLARMFGAAAPVDTFPDVGAGLLGLLGISHSGFLVEKAVPHTQDPPPARPPAPEDAAAPGFPGEAPVRQTARPLGQP